MSDTKSKRMPKDSVIKINILMQYFEIEINAKNPWGKYKIFKDQYY